jgi:hypothetical protein
VSPYALWSEKSNNLNQSSLRPRIRELRSIKVGPRMDLSKFRANSLDGFSIDGRLQKNIHFCGLYTVAIRCNMTRGIEWTQQELSTTSYKGATSVLRSVTLLIRHPVAFLQIVDSWNCSLFRLRKKRATHSTASSRAPLISHPRTSTTSFPTTTTRPKRSASRPGQVRDSPMFKNYSELRF